MADLVTHAFKEHAKNDTNKCAVCSEEFNSVEVLIPHILRIHHLVNEQTLETTEAGIQLQKVWPSENASNFKCYECGQEVGERANIIKHKRIAHYKQKNCTSYHQHNYCRFSARDCIYIHRPEERQWRQAGLGGDQRMQEVQDFRQARGEVAICNNGPGCSWLANNRCRFQHEAVPVRSVVPPSASSPPSNIVTSSSSSSTTTGNTIQGCMKAIMDRLEQLEIRMQPNLSGFISAEGEKKSQ